MGVAAGLSGGDRAGDDQPDHAVEAAVADVERRQWIGQEDVMVTQHEYRARGHEAGQDDGPEEQPGVLSTAPPVPFGDAVGGQYRRQHQQGGDRKNQGPEFDDVHRVLPLLSSREHTAVRRAAS